MELRVSAFCICSRSGICANMKKKEYSDKGENVNKTIRGIILCVMMGLLLMGCSSKKEDVRTEEHTKPDRQEILEPVVIELPDREPKEEPQEEPTETPSPMNVNDLGKAGKDIVAVGVDPSRAKEIDALFDSLGKSISLAVWSRDGKKVLLYNTEQQYFSACTVKVPWMLYLCKGIDSGKYSKDTVLTYEKRHYHKGSGTIRKGEYGDTYTVEKLINLCLSISDNVAFEMLVEQIDRKDFNAFTKQLGYQSFNIRAGSVWSNNSVVKDYVGIWNEVYKYFEEDTVGSRLMKKSCTNTPFAYGVLTLKGTTYSHKSGDNFPPNSVYNDAGIVWAESPYIYAMFSKSDENKEEVAKINQAMTIVHELFG